MSFIHDAWLVVNKSIINIISMFFHQFLQWNTNRGCKYLQKKVYIFLKSTASTSNRFFLGE